MALLTLTWATSQDERVCPICFPLHGRVWTFDTAVEPWPERLNADGQVVWDTVEDQPRTHGDHPYNCRCTLLWRFDLGDEKMRLLQMVGVVEEWSNGLTVLVARSASGRFVAWSVQS
jgi:hypothetical protein